MSKAHSPHLSSHLGVPARTSNQLTEVTVEFADPPHSWRISKLSQKYWCDKHRQRAARKRTPSAVHTMDAANAFGLAGAVHAVSAASLAAGSNSTALGPILLDMSCLLLYK